MALTWEYFHENKHSLKYAGFWFVCQKSQNFFTHLHFCRENFWCLIRCINFFERCDISLLFPLPLSEMKNIFFLSQFRRLQKKRNVRCSILADPKQGCRLKILDFSTTETVSKDFFHFSQEGVRNGELFLEHSQFQVRGKTCKLNMDNRLQVWARQYKFLSALYPREKVSSGRVFPPFLRHRWQILEKSISKVRSGRFFPTFLWDLDRVWE